MTAPDPAGMRVPLSQGLFAIVDAEDYEDVMRFKWYAQRSGTTSYAIRSTPRLNGRRPTLRMHTYLTGYALTDHIDGDGLNNRRANLREATTRQNGGNRRSGGGSSKYRGVSWHAGSQKWQARLHFGAASRSQEIYLGKFTSETDAARAFDTAARERWGEYAALNFPNPGENSALREGVPA